MNVHRWPLTPRHSPADSATAFNAASAYDQAGDDYLTYADGDPVNLFGFEGRYAYSDRRVWAAIRRRLDALRNAGARSLRVVDAGCGPGTWLRRVVVHAHSMGFTRIVARGFDVAEAQIRRARVLARDAAGLPGVELRFEVSDLARPLPEADNSIDLALCLYCVLNHAPIADVRRVAGEFARVTRGHFIVTVRAVGSQPTIYVDSIDKARDLRQDHEHDLCEVDLHDGRHLSFASHLFTAVELRGIIGGAMEVDEVRGLDLFHNRFAPDARWNPATLVAPEQFFRELACLEETFATDPNFIDRATHLMAVAHPRSARRRAAMRD